VGKIKQALPSRRCSQRIRVKGDRGGARGGGAAWPACGGQEGRWHRVVRPERPLGGGAVVTDALSEHVPSAVGFSTVALGRAQFTVPNRFPFIPIA
jgi:hypothetical protein